jgi:hypothetical protein
MVEEHVSNKKILMKNLLIKSLCCLSFLAVFYSCDESNTIGGSLQPDQDLISVYYDTVSVDSKTVTVDSMLYRSSTAYVGEFTDPYFGTTKPDYLAQLYCPYNFSFPDDVKRVDSSYMYIYYSNWFGDSTTMVHINVYELNTPLNISQSYYTNINPAKYCDKSKLLGQVSFTPGDMYSTDSMRELDTYQTVIKVPIDLSLGNRFLKDSRNYPSKFSSPGEFLKYFNGIYVTSDYGNGTILNVTHSEIEFCYGTYLYSATSGGLRDSFVIGASYFPVTKEVKQVNRFEHPDLSYYLNPNNDSDTLNYVFSPGGLYTRITIPNSVFAKLSGSSVNSMKLKVRATQLDDSDYGMAPPTNMLLIRESDSRNFFSRFEMNDGLNSVIATYDSDEECYTFDLSYYAQKMVREKDVPGSTTFKPFNDMLMIPVTIVESADEDKVRLEQSLTPSAVKIKGAKHPTMPMKLELIYSKGKIN